MMYGHIMDANFATCAIYLWNLRQTDALPLSSSGRIWRLGKLFTDACCSDSACVSRNLAHKSLVVKRVFGALRVDAWAARVTNAIASREKFG
jgi:hypothetical protein